MEAVEQNADDCLGGTRVVNDLKTHNFHEKEPMEVSLQHGWSIHICRSVIGVVVVQR